MNDVVIDEEYVDDHDGYESYEVQAPTAPYLAPRKRINLDGRLMPVSASYARTMEEDNMRLRAENERLREALARSGNRYLLADANDWMTRVRKLEMANASLRAKMREIEAEKNMTISEMETDHRMEVLELSHEADFWKAKYERLTELTEGRAITGRDPKTGRFQNKTNISKDEQRKKAFEMYEQHLPLTKIAENLDIAVDTAKRYIKDEGESRAHQKALESFERAKRKQLAM
jgi:hypothetical protein